MLQVKDVVSFYGEVKALKGVSLQVQEGETVALLGANGAGKTTLLRVITGLNKVSEGEVIFKGKKIANKKPHEIVRMGVAMSPEGREVFPTFSVRENLEIGAYHTSNPKKKKELMEQVLSTFPVLKERINQSGGTLSGGEQQMLTIGRALMSDPDILLLDEPSLGLAPLIIEKIFEILEGLRKQGRTILLVEQNAYAALDISDRGYIIETGNIELEGLSVDLKKNEEVKSKYLGI